MSIKKVVLVGGNGTLGSVVLEQLARTSIFDLTVLKRASSSSSSSSYPKSVSVATVSSLQNFEELKQILSGQDAVVVCIPVKDVKDHNCLAEAAAAAGVKRYIPADFGSTDASLKKAQELVKLYADKDKIRHRLIELALKHEGFTWTSIVGGHFFDSMLGAGHLAVDFKTKSIEVLDDGTVKWSTSTLAQVGRATAAVLQKPDETRNKVIYVQSFCISQQDLLESLMRVAGGEWNVDFVKADKLVEDYRGKTDEHSIVKLVGYLGMFEANWETKKNFSNGLLGLKEEDLDTAVHRVVEDVNKGVWK